MKKIYILILGVVIFLQSCKKDNIGGTSTAAMAGEWYVRVDALNADGTLFDEDVYGVGHFLLSTYNKADNSTDKMWISDNDNFWYFKGLVDINLNALTFGSSINIDNQAEEGDPITFVITNGKILKGLATTPSGMPADSIVFEIAFSDEDPLVPFDRYRFTGFRYTGLVDDEDH